eukprot:34524_1
MEITSQNIIITHILYLESVGRSERYSWYYSMSSCHKGYMCREVEKNLLLDTKTRVKVGNKIYGVGINRKDIGWEIYAAQSGSKKNIGCVGNIKSSFGKKDCIRYFFL